MKQFCLIAFLTLFIQLLPGQEHCNHEVPQPKYPELFKVIPTIEKDAPLWVKTMYASELNFYELRKQVQAYYNSHTFEKSIHTHNLRYLCKIVQSQGYVLDDGTVHIPTANEKVALRQGRQARYLKSLTTGGNNAWHPVGPFVTYKAGGVKQLSVSTNLYCFDQSLSNPDVIYAGAETGALFKSTDKAQSWTSVGDHVFDDGAIDIVTVDPSNSDVVYVGAGNRLFKTNNGGQIWNVIKVFTDNVSYHARFFTSLVVNPENTDILFLARKGEGLFRSKDGGVSWTKVIEQDCWDIKLKADDPNTVYAAVTNTAKNITEIHKSIDGGLSFLARTTGWYNPVNGTAINNFGARLAVTNADPNRLYTIVIGNEKEHDAGYIGVFRSDDAGESWYLPYEGSNGVANNQTGGPYSKAQWCLTSFDPNTNGNNYNLGFYSLDIEVSDENPDLFFVGAINLFRSDDGGKNYRWWGGYGCEVCGEDYQGPFERHADVQELEINGSDVWVITDGGVDRYDTSLDNPVSCNVGMNGTEYWGFDQGWNLDVFTGGRYHNGNAAYIETYGIGNNLFLGGGESGTGYVNVGDNRRLYHSDIKGKLLPEQLTGHVIDIPSISKFPSESYIWYFHDRSEMEIDPRCWNTLFLGRDNVLWKSEDGGVTFNAVNTFGEISERDNRIKAIEVSRNNPAIILATQRTGNNAGVLWKSVDGGESWNEVAVPAGGDDAMRLGLNTNDELFLSIRKTVYKSTDWGQNWEQLPGISLYTDILDMAVQDGTDGGVYIASSDAVWYRNNEMSAWSNFSQGLPVHFRVTKIKLFYRDSKIRIAGNRGIWERHLYEKSSPKAQPMVSSRKVNCGRVQFEDYSILNHDQAQWQWSFPGATLVSDSTVRNPEVVYSQPGEYDVTLTITDKAGVSDTKTIKAMVLKSDAECASWMEPANALICSGGYSFAKTPDRSSIKNLQEISIKGWIKPAGIQNDNVLIMGIEEKVGSANRHGLIIRNTNGVNTLSFQWKGQAYTGDEFNHLELPADEWSYVSIVVRDGQIQLKANNKKAVIEQVVEPFALGNLLVGSPSYSDETSYVGLIDEVGFWARALTESEIDLSRHLICTDYDQDNLVAYYHFDQKSGGATPDALSIHKLRFFGSTLALSDAPLSAGISQELVITENQIYDFPMVDFSLDYQGNGIVPGGKVVVSKLFKEPGVKDEVLTERQMLRPYWVINNYGAENGLNGLKALMVKNSEWDTKKMESIRMFYQDENASQGWYEIKNAHIDISGENGFRITEHTLDKFGQLAFDANVPTVIDDKDDSKLLNLYPNPVSSGGAIHLVGVRGECKITLYTLSGKEAFKKSSVGTYTVNINGVKPGIYIYHIEDKYNMKYGKLVIE